MKTYNILLTCAVLLLGFSACYSSPKHPAGTPTDTLKTARETTDAAEQNVSTISNDLAGRIKAGLMVAADANKTQAETPASVFVDNELRLAQVRMAATKHNEDELVKASERWTNFINGQTDENLIKYKEAILEANRLNAALALAQKEKADAREREIALAVEFEKRAVDAEKRYTQKIEDMKNDELNKQRVYLRIAGVLGILVFGFVSFYGGAAAMRLAAPVGVLGVVCLGLAQIVALWWFKWLCGACGLIAAMGSIYWCIQRYKEGTLKEDLEKKLSNVAGTSKIIIETLDDAYDDAEDSIKDWLDKNLFSKLSYKETKAQKNTIHLLRGDEY